MSNHDAIPVLDMEDGSLSSPTATVNKDYIDQVSRMRDDVSKEKHRFKPCTHMTYEVVPGIIYEGYHPITARPSNAALPRFLYSGFYGFNYCSQYLPPVMGSHTAYLPVTARTTDDIADCVFNAYNQFVNGERALDASQSIAELGETPQLFRIWQRRRGLASNLTNGFLNYSFGWRPVLSDLRAISKELRQFPKTVRKRLSKIGHNRVTRHFKFNLDETLNDVTRTFYDDTYGPYGWNHDYCHRRTKSGTKRRIVTVTIRANVKPKLTGSGQELLNKLGALGLIPSLATLWAVTRLSFVIDWFYNIGGAIENLQGSLTHDISNVEICITDARSLETEILSSTTHAPQGEVIMGEKLRYFNRFVATDMPRFIPQLRVPKNPMQYVLLGFIALSGYLNSPEGRRLERALEKLNRTPISFRRKA